MPLRDRDRTQPRRLVRLGIIRLGFKKKSSQGVEYPVQADHFVLTDAPEIATLYGDQPRELDVILPFPDVQRNFDAAYTVWAGGVLVCRGDGEYVEYATPNKVETKKKGNRTYNSVHNAPGDTLVSNGVAQVDFAWNGEEFKIGDHVPCPGAAGNLYPHCAACKVSAILKVMMARPELFRMGYYQIATGSGRNYDTLLGTLELISSSAGHVNGIPFKLRMVKEQTTYRDNGQRKTTEKWFLQLEPEPTFTRQLYSQQAARALGAPAPQLEAGPVDDFDDFEPEAPPPVAEEVIDIETGEIVTEELESEMPQEDGSPVTQAQTSGNGVQVTGTPPGSLVPEFFENVKAARAAVKKSKIVDFSKPPALVVPWAKLYRGFREAGMNSDQATEAADTEVAAY